MKVALEESWEWQGLNEGDTLTSHRAWIMQPTTLHCLSSHAKWRVSPAPSGIWPPPSGGHTVEFSCQPISSSTIHGRDHLPLPLLSYRITCESSGPIDLLLGSLHQVCLFQPLIEIILAIKTNGIKNTVEQVSRTKASP